LRLSLESEPRAIREESGDLAVPGESASVPTSSLYIYDIVERWRSFTSLPAVLAVWAGRREVVTPELATDFQQSLAFGLRHLDEISAEASRELDLPAQELRRYLTDNIDYTLDEENLRGLRRYFDLAAELGLVPAAKALEIASARAPELAARR
jgi:chorismate dehydratase